MSSLKEMERSSRRAVFSLTSRMRGSTDLPKAVPDGVQLDSILLLRQDRTGDMVMTLPVLRELRRLHPEARICLVATRAGAAVLRREENVEVITLGKSPGAFLHALGEASGLTPDAAVDMHMHDSTTSFIFSRFSGAIWSIHAEGERKLPFDIRVPVNRRGHIIEAFAALLSGLGRELSPVSVDRAPRVGDRETEFALEFWNRSPVPPGECIGVNISAGGDNRWWGAERFGKLCRMLLSDGYRPLVIHGPGHNARFRAVLEAAPGALAAPAADDILHLSALIDGLRLMVSPDTSVVHLAAAHGIPVAGLYLPVTPGLPDWHPWMVPSAVLRSDSSRSLDSITPEDVQEGVRRLLDPTLQAGPL